MPSGSGVSITQEQFLLHSEETLGLHVGGGFGFVTEAAADAAGSESCTGKAADRIRKGLWFKAVTLLCRFTGERDQEGCSLLAHSRCYIRGERAAS